MTVATASHLGQAIVLGESVVRYCPGVRFVIALADRLPPNTEVEFETIPFDNLFPQGAEEVLLQSGVFGVAVSGKPAALREVLLKFADVDLAIFVDSDCWATGDFATVVERLEGKILLSPHSMKEAPEFELAQRALRYGIFNSGFVAVRRSDEANRFVSWWSQMIRSECSSSVLASSYVDQGYLDLVPVCFPSATVIRSPGLNVGYWTPSFEEVESIEDGWRDVEGNRLTLVHFSGFDARACTQMSRFKPVPIAKQSVGIRTLFGSYAEAVEACASRATAIGWISGELARARLDRDRRIGTLNRVLLRLRTAVSRIGWALVLRYGNARRNFTGSQSQALAGNRES